MVRRLDAAPERFKGESPAENYLVSTDIVSYFENINILVLKDLVGGSDVR